MLVLTRKRNEEIVISDSIRIRVGDLRGQRVRLLIEAPTEVKIRRVNPESPDELAVSQEAELCAIEA